MKMNVYSLNDIKLCRFQPPFVARGDEEAKILIVRAGFNPVVYRDLDLVRIGSFDDESGVLDLCQPYVRIGLPALGGDDNG